MTMSGKNKCKLLDIMLDKFVLVGFVNVIIVQLRR